jgi:hypothetical protein
MTLLMARLAVGAHFGQAFGCAGEVTLPRFHVQQTYAALTLRMTDKR